VLASEVVVLGFGQTRASSEHRRCSSQFVRVRALLRGFWGLSVSRSLQTQTYRVRPVQVASASLADDDEVECAMLELSAGTQPCHQNRSHSQIFAGTGVAPQSALQFLDEELGRARLVAFGLGPGVSINHLLTDFCT
jgi:hypothetical protein